jgi:hypothetical protein
MQKSVPQESAVESLHVPANVQQEVQETLQKQMQQMQQQMQMQQQQMQQQMQMMQQQGIPPEQLQQQMGPIQQQMQQQMQQMQDPNAQKQMFLQTLFQHPYMQQPFLLTDVATLNFDIVLEESPESAVMQVEEYENLLQILPTIASASPDKIPMVLELLFQASQFRSRKQLIEIVKKGPDPKEQQLQEQQQQLAMQEVQTKIELLKAQSQLAQAETAKAMAHAQAGIPASSQLDQARIQEVMAKVQKLMGEVQTTQPAAAQLDHAQAQEALARAENVPEELVQEDIRLDQETERLDQAEVQMVLNALAQQRKQ